MVKNGWKFIFSVLEYAVSCPGISRKGRGVITFTAPMDDLSLFKVELEEEAVSGLLSLINEDAREDLQKGEEESSKVRYKVQIFLPFYFRKIIYIIRAFSEKFINIQRQKKQCFVNRNTKK